MYQRRGNKVGLAIQNMWKARWVKISIINSLIFGENRHKILITGVSVYDEHGILQTENVVKRISQW